MIFVLDLERMTAFYRDVVGCRSNESTRLTDWVEFETTGAGFSLHAIPTHMSQQIEIAAPPIPREQQSCKLIFAVDDIDGELTRLEGLGVPVLRRPWGGCDFIDPEGNIIGIRSTTA